MRRMTQERDEAVALIVAADAQWWRPVKNWRRRREAGALLVTGEDFAAAQEAWDAMSPSERAAENARALRGTPIQPPSR
jgi:hypothetical protein